MNFREKLHKIHGITLEALRETTKRQKRHYDKNTKRLGYNIVDMVK